MMHFSIRLHTTTHNTPHARKHARTRQEQHDGCAPAALAAGVPVAGEVTAGGGGRRAVRGGGAGGRGQGGVRGREEECRKRKTESTSVAAATGEHGYGVGVRLHDQQAKCNEVCKGVRRMTVSWGSGGGVQCDGAGPGRQGDLGKGQATQGSTPRNPCERAEDTLATKSCSSTAFTMTSSGGLTHSYAAAHALALHMNSASSSSVT